MRHFNFRFVNKDGEILNYCFLQYFFCAKFYISSELQSIWRPEVNIRVYIIKYKFKSR